LDRGYGFLCYEYSTEAFWDAIKRAREIFNDEELWASLMRRAMSRDFSWDAAAKRYEQLYVELAGVTEQAAA
jgi:starch synthase